MSVFFAAKTALVRCTISHIQICLSLPAVLFIGAFFLDCFPSHFKRKFIPFTMTYMCAQTWVLGSEWEGEFIKSIIIIRNDVIQFVCFSFLVLRCCCLAVGVNFEYYLTHHAAIIFQLLLHQLLLFLSSSLLYATELYFMRNDYLFISYFRFVLLLDWWKCFSVKVHLRRCILRTVEKFMKKRQQFW